MKLAHLVCLTSVVAIGATACNKPRPAEGRQVERSAIERNDQIAITTRDGKVVLALTKSNTVAMRLSDSLRQHVDAEVAQEFGKDSAESAFGRWVQKTTATLVSKGMGIEFSVPVKEIEDASYEDGEIRFEYRSNRKLKFHSFKNDGRSPMTEFEREDAERFVEAVRDAIHARKT